MAGKTKGPPKRRHACPHCSYIGGRSQDLGVHMKQRHPEHFVPKRSTTTGTKGRFQCRHCEKRFENPRGINTHMRLKHPEEWCKDTGKSIKSPSAKKLQDDRKRGARNGNRPHLVLPGLDYGEKDKIRKALQALAMLYLKGHTPKRSRALCMPGLRPEHERKLFDGIQDVVMVEANGRVRKAAKDNTIIRGNFIDVLIDQGFDKPFSIVDMDLCGRPTYRQGSVLAKAVTLGLVTQRAVIRITFCTRGGKGNDSVRGDMDQFSDDLSATTEVLSYQAFPYKTRTGSTMEVRQWVLEDRP